MNDELAASLAAHDELLARRKVDVWVGGEPTFTRADSIRSGVDHHARRRRQARARARRRERARRCAPGATVMRVIGRQLSRRGARSLRVRACAGAKVRMPAAASVARSKMRRRRRPASSAAIAGCRSRRIPASSRSTWRLAAPRTLRASRAPKSGQPPKAAQLSPVRHRFNGDVADSGGGGQLTLGGATPEARRSCGIRTCCPR